MPRSCRVGQQEREEIVRQLHGGRSQNSVAKSFGRSPSTIHAIAKDEGLRYSTPKRANVARRTFAKERRLELSDALFGKLNQMVEECDDPRRFKELAVVYGILTDKRLLEEGEATKRVEEKVSGNGARERLARMLASVNERSDESGDS